MLTVPAALSTLTSAPAQAQPEAGVRAAAYTVTPLWFSVSVGAADDETCTIDADLYLPTAASAKRPVPAVLTTNGFGGSKADQAGLGAMYAARGYALLSYSGLGFGGSSCPITLDDPDHDGKAARQLVSYLGGETGRAFLDAGLTQPAPRLVGIQRDRRDHLGKVSAFDPRVGMVGGSYGGGAQFAAASVDPRIDTLVPIITWSDLSYSLAPNNTDQEYGVSTTTPGSAKTNWAAGFSALGVAGGLTNSSVDQTRLIGCPNFQPWVCTSLVSAAATGTLDASTQAMLHDRSVAAFSDRIRIPTLLIQGQGDTLFNLNEAVANYDALRANGVPVSMIWGNGGHSEDFLPGEIDYTTPDPRTQYLTGRVLTWFDHYLKDRKVSTGPRFAFYRDWVDFTGNARPAYAASKVYPLPGSRTFYLSGADLVTDRGAIATGSSTFLTPPAGAPTSFDPLDVVGSALPVPVPEQDLPGTTASYTTAALTAPLDVAGIPLLDLTISAPAGALGAPTLFIKILDVDGAGDATLVRNLIAPVRVPDPSQPFTVRMPGIVHRFDTGHQLRLVVAGGSTNYRGAPLPGVVTIATGDAGQALRLPVAR
ncbi:MAG: ABC transporter ATP-binding protein [Actinobacteria bacterium]|nr:ABC transporter ATP-binding protein [Actinomycetota bacterium]